MKNNLVRIRQQKGLSYLNLPNNQPKSLISKADAELLVHKLNSASNSIFTTVVNLVQTHGYIALGFSSPTSCLKKRVSDLSGSYICRLLKACDTYLMLDPELGYLNMVAESTFRPLQDVPESHAQDV